MKKFRSISEEIDVLQTRITSLKYISEMYPDVSYTKNGALTSFLLNKDANNIRFDYQMFNGLYAYISKKIEDIEIFSNPYRFLIAELPEIFELKISNYRKKMQSLKIQEKLVKKVDLMILKFIINNPSFTISNLNSLKDNKLKRLLVLK